MAKILIPPAKLLSSKSHLIPVAVGQYLVDELSFSVPLNYRKPNAETLQLFGRSVRKYEHPIVPPSPPEYLQNLARKPWMVYCEGGPGFGNQEPQNMPLTKTALERGYQVLYLDYRGTGLSTPVTADLLESKGGAQEQADYLRLFRQDSIVCDLEAVRQVLTENSPEEVRQWSLFGQSFGGFVALTYLSRYPEGLREVFLTGGLAPVGRSAEEVYRATYRKAAERNEAYYKKFPEDGARLARLASFLADKGGSVPLPAGGKLTFPRVMTLGSQFGAHGGLDSVHATLLRAAADLEQVGYLTRPTLVQFEQATPFDTAPIYAILHEAIYCDGPGSSSSWAAQRVGKGLERFGWLSGAGGKEGDVAAAAAFAAAADESSSRPPFFSGEMIFPLHFETYPELARMSAAAEILARADDWGPLYNEGQLARNQVPLYAASYIEDLYVDYGFARETAAKVKGTKVFETNVVYHNGLRARSDEILGQLLRLRDDTID
ncbi:hypothetical protein RB600_002478 [Gaeumannomyces tritici]